MVFKLLMTTIFPFDEASILDSNKIMTFRDKQNYITSIVGKVEEYNSKELFYNYLVGNNIKCNVNQIKEAYVRYYSILPKKTTEAYIIANNEGYTFCGEGRGAFKVYSLKI